MRTPRRAARTQTGLPPQIRIRTAAGGRTHASHTSCTRVGHHEKGLSISLALGSGSPGIFPEDPLLLSRPRDKGLGSQKIRGEDTQVPKSGRLIGHPVLGITPRSPCVS